MERVSVRRGKQPVLFVAPHGPDDNNTAIIAEKAAESCDGFYVINNGFERKGGLVDVDDDKADCNRIDHVLSEVVKEEFLDPITKFVEQMKNIIWSGSGIPYYVDPATVCKPLIFFVHGAGDHVHREVGEDVAVIVGYGLSHKNNSLTCEDWRRKLFVHSYRSMGDGEVYEGRGGGNYGARSINNMNQYFRKHEPDMLIDSMQLEFPYSARCTESIATMTGVLLATVAQDILNYDPSNPLEVEPKQKFI